MLMGQIKSQDDKFLVTMNLLMTVVSEEYLLPFYLTIQLIDNLKFLENPYFILKENSILMKWNNSRDYIDIYNLDRIEFYLRGKLGVGDIGFVSDVYNELAA